MSDKSGGAQSWDHRAGGSSALLPAVVRLNSRIVKRGFWSKLRGLAGRAPIVEDALALWFCAFDRETPTATKALILAALAVFVLPKRFLPRQLPGLKIADDAAVIAAAIAALGRSLQPRHREQARHVLERITAS